MNILRRQFLKHSTLAAAGTLMAPRFLQQLQAAGLNTAEGEKTVVIIQLSGGNDGLNTVIPVRNDIYYRMRPNLGISKEAALPLTDEAGLHPALPFFRQLFHEGHLAVLNQVGYPNPDRSHFRSMDIWHTASESNEYWQTGWLGRFLDAQCQGCGRASQIMEVDDVLSLALKGTKNHAIAARDLRRLHTTSRNPLHVSVLQHHHPEEPVAAYLYKTMVDTRRSAEYLFAESRRNPSTATYPNSSLGRSLQTVASLLFSESNTRVFYLNLGSFDTHVNQEPQQKRLFAELNDAVEAFVKDVKSRGRFQDLLLFTFSEFGRRVAQNASGGTDHGTANCMFFISGGLRQTGFINPMPDLTLLVDNDLVYEVDFRRVYSTILQKWLHADATAILGKPFEPLTFI